MAPDGTVYVAVDKNVNFRKIDEKHVQIKVDFYSHMHLIGSLIPIGL